MLTAEQKKERLSGIGGSEVGYIAGISPYKSPLDIYFIKTGQTTDDDVSNEAIEVGNDLESYVADKYATRNSVEIFKPENAIVHPEYYWMRCHLDFVVTGTTIVGECKTAGFLGSEWGEELTDEIPTPYLLQCAHNAIVSEHLYGTTRVDLPVFAGGRGGLKHKVYTYHRNKKLEDNIIEMERKFWQEHVEKMIPPTPRSYKEAAIVWNSPEDGSTAVADDDAIEAINTIKAIREQVKELEKTEEEFKLRICQILKDSPLLVDSDGNKLASWNAQKSNRMDIEEFKSLHPNLYKAYLKESKNRVLRIS